MSIDDDLRIERLKECRQWNIARLTTSLLRKCEDIEIHGEIMCAAYFDEEKVVKQELLIAIRQTNSLENRGLLLWILDKLEDKTFVNQFHK